MILVIEPFTADKDDFAIWNAVAGLSSDELERSYYAEQLDKGLRQAKPNERIKLVCADRLGSDICAELLGMPNNSKLLRAAIS